MGHDFNHESPATREFVKRVLRYWQQEYRVDGFRFDLSKGFTQKQTSGNSGLFAQLDPTRVAILKDYANYIWETDPKAYVIMEHFAENAEGNRTGKCRDDGMEQPEPRFPGIRHGILQQPVRTGLPHPGMVGAGNDVLWRKP
ncbi:MAG: hypothetical protein IPK21_22755 [Haliscomenobacter sp.]|nr:hypothetical protein [Haliscomenobacter sp.]